MITVIRKDNYTFDDCNRNRFEFRTDEFIVDFYQSGNRDLYFTCYPKDDTKTGYLKIHALNNYILYKLVDKVYKDITDLTRWEYNTFSMKLDQSKLFNGNYISWESDDYCKEELDGTKKYNYLNIYQKEDEYVLEFINNSDRSLYSIAFNTDRSKYGIFVGVFMTFLNDLEKVTYEVHQMDFEELVTMKKLTKKYKGDING